MHGCNRKLRVTVFAMENFHTRLAAARQKQGLTVSDVAKRLGVSHQAVMKWESGASMPRGGRLDDIAAVVGVSAAELVGGEQRPDAGMRRKNLVPLISWVCAGEWSEAIETDCADAWWLCPVAHSMQTFALTVEGDSMFPDYQHGDIIFVDPQREATNGSDVVVRDAQGRATFKRLQRTHDGAHLLAVNPDWPRRIIPLDDDAEICGVVIFSGRAR